MRVTPYGVKPYLKRILSNLKPKQGYLSIGIPLKGLDLNEEEQ